MSAPTHLSHAADIEDGRRGPSEVVKEVVDQQGGRYKSFSSQFASGFQETRLEMYKWLLYPILAATSQKLEEGFKYADLRRAMKEHHPLGKQLNLGNLTQALQSTASLQVAKDIKPIILDYDQTNSTLDAADRGFAISGICDLVPEPRQARAIREARIYLRLWIPNNCHWMPALGLASGPEVGR